MDYVELGNLITPAQLLRAGSRSLPILSMTMHGGLVDQTSKFKKRVASQNTSTYKVVSRNQLVVGFPIDEGVLSFQDLYDEAIVSPAYDVWELQRQHEADPHYLEYFLRSPIALSFYASKLRGTTARRRTLPDDIFLRLRVPLPNISEQQRIVATLDKADSFRHKRRKAIGMLDELLRSIFIEMFGDPATNPKGWPERTIGELVSEVTYGTSSKAGETGEYSILRMNNITYSGNWDFSSVKYIDLLPSERERYLVRDGDILFNRTNSKELVGKTAVYRREMPMAYAGYLIRVRVNEDNDSEYVSAFLNSRYGKAILQNMCKSIIGMANINATELKSILIMQPDAKLQRQFAGIVRAALTQQEKMARAAEMTDDLFASLQQRLFSGCETVSLS